MADNPFTINRIYKRSQIHNEFGGSSQSGISPTANYPFIFIFSGKSGQQHGYKDQCENADVFSYTGEGQVGDMIAIMWAFVEIRKVLLQQNDLKLQLREIKEKLGGYDAQLNKIYDAMENLLDEKAAQRKWDARERIGFK